MDVFDQRGGCVAALQRRAPIQQAQHHRIAVVGPPRARNGTKWSGRIYDPFTRRFLTPDPFVMDPLNPQGLNRFAYVRNNPLNLVDPTGFEDMGGGGCYNGCGPDSGSISMGGASSSGSSGSQSSASSTSQGGSGTFTSDGFSASGYETVDLGSGSGPRPGDTPGRTNGNVNGSGATSAPLPYTPNSPVWLQEAASLAVTMSLTPAAKLVLESFGAREVATFGPKSVGAAQRVWQALQKGGHTIKPSTAKALNEAHGLNLHAREWGRALEGLKADLNVPNDFHGIIMESGN